MWDGIPSNSKEVDQLDVCGKSEAIIVAFAPWLFEGRIQISSNDK